MTKLDAILWTGYNLEEVIEFVGKSRNFNEWFKSWEEYERYVHEHGGVVKLFAPDGLSVDVLPGTWIVKTPEGFNVPMTNPWLKANKSEPQGLDEAEDEYARSYDFQRTETEAFKAGAKWMAEQGETVEGEIVCAVAHPHENKVIARINGNYNFGDKVIVQIRKKED